MKTGADDEAGKKKSPVKTAEPTYKFPDHGMNVAGITADQLGEYLYCTAGVNKQQKVSLLADVAKQRPDLSGPMSVWTEGFSYGVQMMHKDCRDASNPAGCPTSEMLEQPAQCGRGLAKVKSQWQLKAQHSIIELESLEESICDAGAIRKVFYSCDDEFKGKVAELKKKLNDMKARAAGQKYGDIKANAVSLAALLDESRKFVREKNSNSDTREEGTLLGLKALDWIGDRAIDYVVEKKPELGFILRFGKRLLKAGADGYFSGTNPEAKKVLSSLADECWEIVKDEVEGRLEGAFKGAFLKKCGL